MDDTKKDEESRTAEVKAPVNGNENKTEPTSLIDRHVIPAGNRKGNGSADPALAPNKERVSISDRLSYALKEIKAANLDPNAHSAVIAEIMHELHVDYISNKTTINSAKEKATRGQLKYIVRLSAKEPQKAQVIEYLKKLQKRKIEELLKIEASRLITLLINKNKRDSNDENRSPDK